MKFKCRYCEKEYEDKKPYSKYRTCSIKCTEYLCALLIRKNVMGETLSEEELKKLQ